MAQWWKDRVAYQVYPRSFADTNGDGIGDIPGVIAHLDDLKDLGVGILWLGPLYRSPDRDNGYDISDYRGIDPKYGTMADMDRLIAEATRRDIKLVMDLVINHTSDEHPWFVQSRDKASPYRDYYIWLPGKNGGPPNNWTSFFGEGCWEYDAQSGEYYLHLFAKGQPDLNYRNPKVLEEIKDIMRFWLDKGISGFRCDVINVIFKSSLGDGKRSLILTGHEHYISQPGAHEILQTLRREVLSRYDCFTVGEAVFVTPQMGRDLTDAARSELDMIFSFEHMETDQFIVKWFKRKFHAGRFGSTIAKWQTALQWNANYLENHDQPRSVSRFGGGQYWAQSAKLLCMLLMTLRGTPFVYQGQEIGMTNFDFTGMSQIRDIESINIYNLAKRLRFPAFYRWRIVRATSRDNSRTPYQWDGGENAGFTAGEPWIGVNCNYKRINRAAQAADPDSVLNFYKKMISLRTADSVLKYGSFKLMAASKHLFSYLREYEGRTYCVLLNFGKRLLKAPRGGAVLLSNYGRTQYDGTLQPYEAVMLYDARSLRQH